MLQRMNERKAAQQSGSKAVLDYIRDITDEQSFVELDAYSFSAGEFFEDAEGAGEGVVTGYARIGGLPVYIAAQNPNVFSGALTKAQSDKILKCMNLAHKSGSALLYLLASSGARVGEGLSVLDGYAQIIAKSSALYGEVPQISVINGDCYGSIAYFAALSDVVFVKKGAHAGSTSAAVLSAKSGSAVSADGAAGSGALIKNGFASAEAEDAADLKEKLSAVLEALEGDVRELSEAELNVSFDALDEGYTAQKIIDGVLDGGVFTELGAGCGDSLKTGFARVGGISAGVILSADDEGGALLTAEAADKASSFIRLLDSFGVPLITFVNVSGTELSVEAESRGIVKSVGWLMSAVSDHGGAKLAVVCGKAQGAGYTALASKALGFDYTLSWATASISVLPGDVAVSTVYSAQLAEKKAGDGDRKRLAEKYARIEGDPFNAAHRGLVDNIIQPAATRQYVISALQMLAL